VGVPLSLPVIFSIASESLLFNFSQKDYVRAARAGLRSATLAMQEAHDTVAEDVVATYLELDNAERREAAMSEEYGYATRLIAIVQERLEGGQDSRMELLRAHRTAAQIHLQQLHNEDDIAVLTDHLGRLLGLPGNKFSTVPESIPAMPSLGSLTADAPESFGVQAAFADARAKQDKANGDLRYRYRPQMGFETKYSRISTDFTSYTDYYPAFKNNKSDNAYSVGVQIQLPIFDRAHQDRAHESVAEARRAHYEAEVQRNQFLEGRFKIRKSTDEISARADLAEIERDLAQEELNAVLIRLASPNGGPDQPQTTPKEEQNARIQERAKAVDVLDAQLELIHAKVMLLRQTGTLSAWLRTALLTPGASSTAPGAVSIAPGSH
jgi:outer membrane protein TolC